LSYRQTDRQTDKHTDRQTDRHTDNQTDIRSEGAICIEERNRKKLDAKALMVIGSLCPISVEGVIRGLRWGIGPEGSKALSSHLITYGRSFRSPVCL
jgi:hypothetical protein